MSWIDVIHEDAAEGRLARLYKANIDPEHGVVDNILKVHSLRPDTLDGHLKLYRSALHPRPRVGLSRREREIVGVAVSAYNECHYWVTHHRAGLARILKAEEPGPAEASASPTPLDDATILALNDSLEAIARRGAEPHPQLTPRERAMLVYALKLTATPAAMAREDVSALRAAGLDDGEILDLNQVTAYFAYANRVVDGLGVELEFFHEPVKDGDGKT